MAIDWDEDVPDDLKAQHVKWREELPLLASIQLPRCYFREEPALTVQLHGFCDSSESAYAAVIYVRATYATQPPSCQFGQEQGCPLKETNLSQG